MLWPILQMWIIWCEKPPASLEQCTEVILSIELKQSYCENLDSVSAVFAKLSWNFHLSLGCCSALGENLQYIRLLLLYRRFVNAIEIWPVLMPVVCTWKNGVLLAAFWGKISIFHLGQTEHSLASFDVALPKEHEKPSWIDWTREISLSTCSVLLCWIPTLRSCPHATYRAQRSLTSYRPVVHMCSHFSERVHRRQVLHETVSAPPQVPLHFDCARANGSLFVPPVALISFTSYGAD